MRQIWKYPVPLADEFTIEMPTHAMLLTLQMQDGRPYLWAEVDASHEKEYRRFVTRGTGHTFDAEGTSYVGTWQAEGFVWHVYEVLL